MVHCQKVPFATPEAAERQMSRIASSGKIIGQTAHAYECPYCGQWHWGHRDRYDKAIAVMTASHRNVKWPPRVWKW